jgi:hypothetical protein
MAASEIVRIFIRNLAKVRRMVYSPEAMMLSKVDIQRLPIDVASAALVSSCWHGFETKRQNGVVVLALAGRCAR